MATAFGNPPRAGGDTRFFVTIAWIQATLIVAGFALNLAMGRSTFAVPVIYHVHAFVFFGWVTLYLTQVTLAGRGSMQVHKRLGIVAFGWVPLMVILGFAIMLTSLRRTGGPFFFDQNEFLVSNTMQLVLFAGLVFAALRTRRYTGWHRRLMIGAMAILTGPGLGRLLPMPLLIPNAWRIMLVAILVIPAIGMIYDLRRKGRVHPAWYWVVGLIVGVQIAADIVAYSPIGERLTAQVVAGTPGAERPMAAYIPPGFSM